MANDTKEIVQKHLSMDQIQMEILNEIKRGNALAEREHAESKVLHLEMKGLEEQRFKMTQMFIERSLTLQKQMVDCLRANSTKSMANGNGNDAVSSATDNPFKMFPRTQSSRPQFVLAKKKKWSVANWTACYFDVIDPIRIPKINKQIQLRACGVKYYFKKID